MKVDARSAYMLEKVTKNRNLSIPWFLMTSYLYYHHDMTIVTDASFDSLVRLMIAEWPNIEHRHKQLVTPEMLGAGTAFNLRDGDYPTIAKSAAWAIAREDRHVIFKQGLWRRNS